VCARAPLIIYTSRKRLDLISLVGWGTGLWVTLYYGIRTVRCYICVELVERPRVYNYLCTISAGRQLFLPTNKSSPGSCQIKTKYRFKCVDAGAVAV